MTLENQVTSLDLSKQLKELGVKQESLFYWTFFKDYSQILYTQQEVFKESWKVDPNYCSAFTASELGEMLPQSIEIKVDKGLDFWYWNANKKPYGGWTIELNGPLQFFGDEKTKSYFEEDTEANARAKMLIYLLENKLIKL